MKMTVNGPNVLVLNRSRIASQNLMEGDEFLLRGEPSLFVESIRRNEDKGTVSVTLLLLASTLAVTVAVAGHGFTATARSAFCKLLATVLASSVGV